MSKRKKNKSNKSKKNRNENRNSHKTKNPEPVAANGNSGWMKNIVVVSSILISLLGSGFIYKWIDSWGGIDRKANRVLDLIDRADRKAPTSNNVDGYFAFIRVPKKAKFIREIRKAIHSDHKETFYSGRDDISFMDLEGWTASIDYYWQSEKKIHPTKSKEIAWEYNWNKLEKEKGNSLIFDLPFAKHTESIESIPVGVVAIGLSAEIDNSHFLKKVDGVFVNSIPNELELSNYPVVDMKNSAVLKSIEDHDVKVESSLRYFIPSYNHITDPHFKKETNLNILDFQNK